MTFDLAQHRVSGTNLSVAARRIEGLINSSNHLCHRHVVDERSLSNTFRESVPQLQPPHSVTHRRHKLVVDTRLYQDSETQEFKLGFKVQSSNMGTEYKAGLARLATNLFELMQVCPVLRNFAPTVPRTATPTSAELKTMSGAFPPSSRETRLTVAALLAMRSLPTAVEPVKESLWMCSLSTRRFPTWGVWLRLAGRTLKTPGGNLACSVSYKEK